MACLVAPAAALGRDVDDIGDEGAVPVPTVSVMTGVEAVGGDDNDRRKERGMIVKVGRSAVMTIEGSSVGYIGVFPIAVAFCGEDFDCVFVGIEETAPVPVLMLAPVLVFVLCFAIVAIVVVVVGIINPGASPARNASTILTC